MTDETEAPADNTLFPKTAGERLREARQAQRLELTDIAQRTRVPLRHLQAIEDGNYAAMPTPTYAVGFAKAYARAVGENEVEIAREVRGQADVAAARRPEFTPYETAEPPRMPSGGMLVAGLALALLVVIAAGLWFGTSLFRGDGLDQPAPAATSAFTPEAPPAVVPLPQAGQVSLIASDQVWVRIYDATGQTLLQKTLAAGERYDVPAGANNPMINVGRPDKLQVLLNGSAVAPLGDGRVAIKDVAIGAAALQARARNAVAGPAPAPTATPTPGASPSAASSPSPAASRSVPAAFRSPTPVPTRTSAAPASTGQRDTPPAPAATPDPSVPGNQTGAP